MRAPGSATQTTHVWADSETDSRETEDDIKPSGLWHVDKCDVQASQYRSVNWFCAGDMLSAGVESVLSHIYGAGIVVLTKGGFFYLQHMVSAVRHQVDFNSFMENTGMPCWWRGFWVMEGFVKLLQCLVQGPYRHLPSLWQTQWDCTDPGGSNGY